LREIGQNGGKLVSQVGAMASRAAPAGTLGATPVADRVVASAVRPSIAPFNTTVQNTAPNSDLSADPDLRIGSFDGQTVSRGFLTWDLRQLRGQKIAKATLRMYAEWAPTCQPQTWQVWSSGPIRASTRWPSQPAGQQLWASTNATLGHGTGCAPGWINVDLTELVRNWLSRDALTGTIMVRAADEYSPSGWKRFSSSEGLKPPALGVTLDPTTP
ncbi:MAG TPA: DNRLRE domain-containing protein, partial [Pseudonocardia sp.]